LHRWSKQHGGQVISSQQHFLDSEQIYYTKMYQWFNKTLLSPYTGRISERMALMLSPFAKRKRMTERRSLQDAFNGNVTMFNVYN